MNEIKTKAEKPKGLFQKYIIYKADGTPLNENAEYFVLRLDNQCSDRKHVEACRKAVLLYALEIGEHLPKLSKDLLNKYGEFELDHTKESHKVLRERLFITAFRWLNDEEYDNLIVSLFAKARDSISVFRRITDRFLIDYGYEKESK